MKFKKFLSAATAMALITALSLPVMASAPNDLPESATSNLTIDGDFEGEFEVPKIFMELPTFKPGTLLFDTYNQIGSGQQVICQPLTFVNHSTVPVKIELTSYTLTVTGTGSGATLIDSSVITSASDVVADAVVTGTDKNIFLWFNSAEKDITGDYILNSGGKFVYPEYDNDVPEMSGTVLSSGTQADVEINLGIIERGRIMGETFEYNKSTAVLADELGTKSSLTLKLDGMLNPDAVWGNDTTVKIVPTFNILPQELVVVQHLTNPVSILPSSVTDTAGKDATITIIPTTAYKLKLFADTLAQNDFKIFGIDADGKPLNSGNAITDSVTPGTFVITDLDATVKIALDASDSSKFEVNVARTAAATNIKEGKLFIQVQPAAFSTKPDGLTAEDCRYIVIDLTTPKATISVSSKAPSVGLFANGAAGADITIDSTYAFASAVEANNFTVKVTSGGTDKTSDAALTTTATFTPDKKSVTLNIKQGAAPTYTIQSGDVIEITAAVAAYESGVLQVNNKVSVTVPKEQAGDITTSDNVSASDIMSDIGAEIDIASATALKTTLTSGTHYAVSVKNSGGQTKSVTFTTNTLTTVDGADLKLTLKAAAGTLVAGDVIVLRILDEAYATPMLTPDALEIELEQARAQALVFTASSTIANLNNPTNPYGGGTITFTSPTATNATNGLVADGSYTVKVTTSAGVDRGITFTTTNLTASNNGASFSLQLKSPSTPLDSGDKIVITFGDALYTDVKAPGALTVSPATN